MTDRPMDSFDGRLADLMAAYGDRAVTAYDAAAIARVATTRRPGLRLGLGLAFHVGRGARLLLLAAAVALLALLAAFAAGSPRQGALTTIVLGATGPERTVYRVPLGPMFRLTLENRSDITWLPWGGFAEKYTWCHLVSGSAVPGNPCAVAPHSTIVLRPPSVPVGRHEIHFAPPGVDWQEGVRVIVDVVAEP
jgi:hypothetical protein